jgi:hypothetical protein
MCDVEVTLKCDMCLGGSVEGASGSGGEWKRKSTIDGFEIEESEVILPHLWKLPCDSRSDSWVLFHELAPLLRVKTREALLKQLGQDASHVLREMKVTTLYLSIHPTLSRTFATLKQKKGYLLFNILTPGAVLKNVKREQ